MSYQSWGVIVYIFDVQRLGLWQRDLISICVLRQLFEWICMWPIGEYLLTTINDLGGTWVRLWQCWWFLSRSSHIVYFWRRTAIIKVDGLILKDAIKLTKVVNHLVVLANWFHARWWLFKNLAWTRIRLINSLAASSDNLNAPATTHIWHIENFFILYLGLFPFGVLVILRGQIKIKRVIATVLLVWLGHKLVYNDFVLGLLRVIGRPRIHGVSFVLLACLDHGFTIRRDHVRLSNDWIISNTSSLRSAILDTNLLVMHGVHIALGES